MKACPSKYNAVPNQTAHTTKVGRWEGGKVGFREEDVGPTYSTLILYWPNTRRYLYVLWRFNLSFSLFRSHFRLFFLSIYFLSCIPFFNSSHILHCIIDINWHMLSTTDWYGQTRRFTFHISDMYIEPFVLRLHVGFVCMKCRKRKNLDLIIHKTVDRLYALKIHSTVCYIFLN